MKKIKLLLAIFSFVVLDSCSNDNETQTQMQLPSTPGFEKVSTNLPKLAFHQTVVFNGKIWVIGGVTKLANGQEVYTNGIYSSTNGVNFTNHGNAPFAERGYHQVVVFNSQIWVFGGVKADPSSTTVYNDVWSSPDGVTWSQVTLIGSHFGYRYGHQMFVKDNKIWCIGGYNQSSGIVGDIWYSSDGQIWNNLSTAGINYFGKRALQTVTVFNDDMLLIGGNTDTGRKKDIWKNTNSNQGNVWTEVVTNGTTFSEREAHITVTKNNKLYLIGGSVDNSVWVSNDGVEWLNKYKIGSGNGNLVGHQADVFNNKILVTGGLFENNKYSSDIYKSNF